MKLPIPGTIYLFEKLGVVVGKSVAIDQWRDEPKDLEILQS